MSEIYLDNAATTQTDPAVIEAMNEAATVYGNPSSIHRIGSAARTLVERARKTVADYLNCFPENIVFTSGGTESNAIAMNSPAILYRSAVEHESIMLNAQADVIPVDRNGTVSPYTLERILRADNSMRSISAIMASNNEISCYNDIPSLADVVHKANTDNLIHVDCVQAAPYCRLDVQKLKCDTLSISGHKIYAPKGTGVLYAKNTDRIFPRVYGSSSQERGLRGGTENVPAIVGLAKAIELLDSDFDTNNIQIECIKCSFYAKLCSELERLGCRDAMHVNGFAPSLPGRIISLTFDGVDAQTLVLAMSTKEIYISAGSACNSHETTPSRVLKAIGLTDEQANSTVRVSFGKNNTEIEAIYAAEAMAGMVHTLRSMRCDYGH